MTAWTSEYSMGYFLSKNTKKTKDTHPDLRINFVDDNGTWTEVAALWKAKSGKGYNVKFGGNVRVIIEPTAQEMAPVLKQDTKPEPMVEYPKEDINPEDIPF